MNKALLLIAAIALALPASAATSYINFANSAIYGTGQVTSGTATTTLAGTTQSNVTYTVSAYSGTSLATLATSGTTANNYSGNGLGICSGSEAPSCSANEHQVDNYGRYEFFLFTFNTAVDLGNMVVQNYGSVNGGIDVDASYWWSTSASATVSTLVGGTQFNADKSSVSSGTDYTTDLVGAGVRTLLVGSRIGAGADATTDSFKLRSLQLLDSSVSAAVPEPATFALGGFALIALGMARRRRSNES